MALDFAAEGSTTESLSRVIAPTASADYEAAPVLAIRDCGHCGSG